MDKTNSSKRFPWLWVLIGIIATSVFLLVNFDDIMHRVMIASTRANIDTPATIPFSLERGLIVVQADLAGTPLAMILDSGAFETRLSADTAAELGVRARINDDVGDTFGRSFDMGIATLSSFTLGSATWQRATAGILVWGPEALTPCVAQDGIIGGTTMRHASWLIDFEANQIHIGNAKTLPSTFKSDLEMKSLTLAPTGVSLEPKITINVNGRSIENILVDTGSNGGLTLPRGFLEQLDIPKDTWVIVEDNATTGIFGVTDISSVLAPVLLQIGDTPPVNIYAEFTDDSAPKLGTQILSLFTIAIVPAEKKLYIAAHPATERNAALLNSPLRHGFIPVMSEDGTEWVVVYRERHWQEVQAADGADQLAIGTRFTTINGLTPQAAFENRCALFMGIRDLIETPNLVLERSDGSLVTLGESRQ